jgi:hypothetical protein
LGATLPGSVWLFEIDRCFPLTFESPRFPGQQQPPQVHEAGQRPGLGLDAIVVPNRLRPSSPARARGAPRAGSSSRPPRRAGCGCRAAPPLPCRRTASRRCRARAASATGREAVGVARANSS